MPPSRAAGLPRTRGTTSEHAEGPRPSTQPKGRGGTGLATFPGAWPSGRPHFLSPCIVLAENPGGSHTGGDREEGRGRSWGKRMRRKRRRRRKTTSSPRLGRPVKVWRSLRPPGPGSREAAAPAPTLRTFPPLAPASPPGPGPAGSLPGGRPRAAAPPPKMAGPSLRPAGLGAGPAAGRGGSRAPGRAGPRPGRTLTGTMAGRSRRSLR